MWQSDPGYLFSLSTFFGFPAKAIFALRLKIVEIGKYPQIVERDALRQILGGIGKQRNISSEFINDHAQEAISICGWEQRPSAYNLSKDAAALNIGNQN